jgi:hypothetical protein
LHQATGVVYLGAGFRKAQQRLYGIFGTVLINGFPVIIAKDLLEVVERMLKAIGIPVSVVGFEEMGFPYILMFVAVPNAGFRPIDGLFEMPEIACVNLGERTSAGKKEKPDEDGGKVRGLRFEVQGLRFKVRGSRFKVRGSKFKVQG